MDSDVASILTSLMMKTPAHEDESTLKNIDIEEDNLNTSIESSVSVSVVHSIRPTQEIRQAEAEKSHHVVNETILEKLNEDKSETDKDKTDIEEYECKATQTQEEDLENVDMLVFRDKLISHLGLKKEKGKDRLKWNGSITDLKDFLILILKEDGKWQSRKQNGKTIHIFQQAKSKFNLTWWVSSKTFNIQGGDEKYFEKLQKKIDRLIQKREESILEENSSSKPAVKQKKR